MAFQSNAFQSNAFQGVGAAPGGGPIQVGPATIVCVATVVCAVSVKKAIKSTASGAASVSTPVSVKRSLARTITGGASVSSPVSVRRTFALSPSGTATIAGSLTVRRGLVATIAGTGTFSPTFTNVGKPIAVAATIVGTGTVEAPVTVLRTAVFHTPKGLGGMSVTISSVSAESFYVGFSSPLAGLRQMLAEARRILEEMEGHTYAGPRGEVTGGYKVYPPGTIDDHDRYVALASNEVYDNEMDRLKAEQNDKDLDLELGRRRLRLNRGPTKPGGWTMPKERDKIVKEVASKQQREAEWGNKAKMARVRSFKKRS